MTDGDSIPLRDWMTEKFAAIEKRLDTLANNMVGLEKFNSWSARLASLEAKYNEHDNRLLKIEREAYSARTIINVLVPVVIAILTAIVVALTTGKAALIFKP